MAKIEIVRGSRIEKRPDSAPAVSPEPKAMQQVPSEKMEMAAQQQEGPGLLARLGHSFVKGLELPGELVNQIAMALGEPSFMKKRLSEDIRGYLGATEEQLKPQGAFEEYSQRVLQQGPSAALFGPAALARTAASAVPAVAAGQLGAPDWAQDLIQFGSDLGLSLKSGAVKLPSLAKAQKNAYEVAKSLVSDAERPGAARIIESLTNVGKQLETEVDESKIKRVNHVIDTIKKNFAPIYHHKPGPLGFESGLNPNKALVLRKKIYGLGKRYPDLIEYTKPITEGINSFLTEYGASNPKFFESLSKADRLTEAKHMKSTLEGIARYIPFIGGKGIGSSTIGGIVGKGIIGDIMGKIVGDGEKLTRNLLSTGEKGSHVRSLYYDLVGSLSKGNAALIEKNAINLLQEINPQEEGAPLSAKPSKKRLNFELVKGKKIK